MATYTKQILSGLPASYPNLITSTSTTLSSGTSVTSVASPGTTTATISTATLSSNSNIITYTTSATHSFVVGQLISITGTNDSNANILNSIILSITSNTFTISTTYKTSAINATGGTATSYNAVFTTTSTTQFSVGQLVSVTNLTTAGYNVSTAPIIAVGGSSGSFTFTVPVLSTATGAISSQTGSATASPLAPTLIHNATASISGGFGYDEVWIYASNSSANATTLTLLYGASQTASALYSFSTQIITIPAQSGLVLITPGLILSSNASQSAYSAIYAYASTPNVIAISGYVNRIV